MTRYGNRPLLRRMVVLPVAALCSSQPPAVFFKTPDYISNLH
jgi:hypothetical protein